jgi:hypothetical protein
MLGLKPVVRFLLRGTACGVCGVAVLVAVILAGRASAAEKTRSPDHTPSTTEHSAAGNEDTAAKAGQKTAADLTSPSGTKVEQLIARLASTDFRTREDAAQALVAAGAAAIEPLSKAAQAKDLEVSYRAVHVLQSLLEQADSATQQQAAAALELLSNGNDYAAADLAADALAVYHLTQQDRALESLRRLGATISEVGFGDQFQIVLDSQWHGKTADLDLLKQVTRVNHLRILYVKLDDAAVKIFGQLGQLDFIDLIGTGVSEESASTLAQSLPGVKIDRRNGAMLGVGPSMAQIGCTIGTVVDGSAAMAADFRVGDEILSIDGHPVQKFEELTALIGAKSAGETAAIELRRSGQLVTKEVALGKWQN